MKSISVDQGASELSIDVSDLPDGMYIFKSIKGDNYSFNKIIVPSQ